MAAKRQRRNGTWEFKFQRKGVLPNPVYFTFDTLEEGEAYEKIAEEVLSRGVVPSEMGEAGLVPSKTFLTPTSCLAQRPRVTQRCSSRWANLSGLAA